MKIMPHSVIQKAGTARREIAGVDAFVGCLQRAGGLVQGWGIPV